MNFLRFALLIFLVLGLGACNSVTSSRIKPTEIPPFIASAATPTNATTLKNAPTAVPTAIATNTPTSVPTATPTPPNTPTQTPTATPTKPLFTPTPTLVPIPKGKGALIVFNYYGTELNYDIESKLYKIKGNSSQMIFVSPGNHTYSATIPGFAGRSGIVEIRENYYRVQEWGR